MNLTKKISNTSDLANLEDNTTPESDLEHNSLEAYLTFIHEVRSDLVTLSEIIKDRKKKDKEYDFPFLVKSPWE